MKTMTMEKAVEYCKDKRVAIHTPTQEVYDKFGKYVDKSKYRWLSENWFPENEHDTCVNLECNHSCYADLPWYKDNGYEIIELVDEPVKDDTLIITIKSDGHKVVTATCNDIIVKAKCNDSDTFNLSKGSHIALKRLIDKMNEPTKPESKFNVGDIVEIIGNSKGAYSRYVGLQGVVVSVGKLIKVKLVSSLGSLSDKWVYAESDLKLICKAQ